MTEYSTYGADREIKVHQPTDHERIISLLDYNVEFRVTVQSVAGEDRTMLLSLNCLIGKKKRLYWDIKKSPVGIGLLNQRVEEECGWACPTYYLLVGSLFTANRTKIN